MRWLSSLLPRFLPTSVFAATRALRRSFWVGTTEGWGSPVATGNCLSLSVQSDCTLYIISFQSIPWMEICKHGPACSIRLRTDCGRLIGVFIITKNCCWVEVPGHCGGPRGNGAQGCFPFDFERQLLLA